MNDQEFREAVYRKYELCKSGQGMDFLNAHPRRHTRTILLTLVLVILLAAVLAGTIAAATHYLPRVWKEPVPYDLEDQTVAEEDRQQALTEESVRKTALGLVSALFHQTDEIISCTLTKDPSLDTTFWEISTAGGYSLRLTGETGKAVWISSSSGETFRASDRVTAERVSAELLHAFPEDSSDYTLTSLVPAGVTGWWQADYCRVYDGVANPYQCIRLLFAPAAGKLLTLNFFDDPFENNPYIVLEKEALAIVTDAYGAENIREIHAEKSINKMNAMLYEKEHGGNWRTDGIVRNVWYVTVTNKETGHQMIYFVDGTTGELIGGDEIKGSLP